MEAEERGRLQMNPKERLEEPSLPLRRVLGVQAMNGWRQRQRSHLRAAFVAKFALDSGGSFSEHFRRFFGEDIARCQRKVTRRC